MTTTPRITPQHIRTMHSVLTDILEGSPLGRTATNALRAATEDATRAEREHRAIGGRRLGCPPRYRMSRPDAAKGLVLHAIHKAIHGPPATVEGLLYMPRDEQLAHMLAAALTDLPTLRRVTLAIDGIAGWDYCVHVATNNP